MKDDIEEQIQVDDEVEAIGTLALNRQNRIFIWDGNATTQQSEIVYYGIYNRRNVLESVTTYNNLRAFLTTLTTQTASLKSSEVLGQTSFVSVKRSWMRHD